MKLSIAPMIDWSYSYFRIFMRLLAPKSLIYTEMQATRAVIHNPELALFNKKIEHPLALQLGGSCPEELSFCAKDAQNYGFNEINLNIGCPSSRVNAGNFGVILMKDAQRVADCIKALKDATSLIVSAKIRNGVDAHDSEAYFLDFCEKLVSSDCDKIIVHARKAWLKGLSPKQNRTIPPINYDYAKKLKKTYPNLPVVINGELDITNVNEMLVSFDGVMLGRLACNNPYQIALIEHKLSSTKLNSRSYYIEQYLDHVSAHNKNISLIIKPLLNMAFGLENAKSWKSFLTEIISSKKVNEIFKSPELMRELELSSS